MRSRCFTLLFLNRRLRREEAACGGNVMRGMGGQRKEDSRLAGRQPPVAAVCLIGMPCHVQYCFPYRALRHDGMRDAHEGFGMGRGDVAE